MSSTQSSRPLYETKQEDVEGYTRIKHTYIRMRDGVQLCADIFLPFSASKEGKKVPVLCSMGPYGKDIHASEFGLPHTPIYANMYKTIRPLGPDACFELCEPLIWTKDYGYALLRVDVRGIGGSEGRLDPFGLERSQAIQDDAEGQDLYDIVEWAAAQPWSSGKVAFSGISYYGMVGYWAAMQKPPHLTCVMSYESQCDLYQAARRGGIYSANFQEHWYNNIVVPYQAGQAEKSLSDKELRANRADYNGIMEKAEYPTDGPWAVFNHSRKLSNIEVPIYLAGNWTDPELHLAGNIRAYNAISSKQKWLEMHTGNHLGAFYEPDHIARQRQFLDHFLFDKRDNGMLEVPQIRLLQHHGSETFYRENEKAFPPTDRMDVPLYLDPRQSLTSLKPTGPKKPFEYQGLEGRLKFLLDEPFASSFEILGSPYLEVELLTDTEDLDLFVYLRSIDANGKPVILKGNHGEPMDSFARGYFRLSHRDEVLSGFKESGILVQSPEPKSEVVPGKTYTVTVPLFPTAYLFDKGTKLEVEIGATNTESTIPAMRHNGGGRTKERFGGRNVLFSHGVIYLPKVNRPAP